jgi:hypothetical protein
MLDGEDLVNVEPGIPPTPGQEFELLPADQAAGVDTILDAALAFIRAL